MPDGNDVPQAQPARANVLIDATGGGCPREQMAIEQVSIEELPQGQTLPLWCQSILAPQSAQ
jgi:hypothetical protein